MSSPQFINVLRGEMSLVGPRAERPQLVEKFQQAIPFYRARLLGQPGVTGWAQINFVYAGKCLGNSGKTGVRPVTISNIAIY